MHSGANTPPYPRHFDGKRFFNPGGPSPRGFFDVLRWKFTSRPEPSPVFAEDVTPSRPPSQVDLGQLHMTMINHSTVLLQQHNLHILTDPIWSERASPVARIGPRRRRIPGVRWEDLPRIDAVLLSHNHYDHLDLPTLRRLMARGQSQFIVPRGVGQLLTSQGIGPIHELDWGDCLSLGTTRIHGVPAVHFSARGLFDRNRSLWCGYFLETPCGAVYFAGDTAFGDHFAAIRERFRPPRLALLPIGAYRPRWFMSAVHMDPEEAVQAHKILDAAASVAIHHGTFQLADEALDTPQRQLQECAPESFTVLQNGQAVTIA